MKVRLSLKKILLFTFVFIVLGLLFLSDLDPDASYDGHHQRTSEKTVTIILIDGLSKDVFEQELRSGKLPNFKNIISKSTYVENGISSFPTMTGYAFYPFITGIDATLSGIHGLRWFDRTLDKGNLRNYVGRTNIHMNEDITREYKNLFERFDDYYTCSINSYMNRGVHQSLKSGWAHTTAKYSEEMPFSMIRKVPFTGKNLAKNHFQHESLVIDLAIDQLDLNPKVQWLTLPALDAHNHVHGTDSIYYFLLRHLDTELGRFFDATKAKGQDDRMIAIVTDHGVSDVSINLDIPGILKAEYGLDIERGKATHIRSDKLDIPLSSFVDKDGYFIINGNLSAYMVFKDQHKEGSIAWRTKRTGVELINYPTAIGELNLPLFISKIEGVDLVCYQSSQNEVTVVKAGERAKISKVNKGYSYHPVDSDVLGIADKIEIDSIYSSEEILNLTHDSDYPYAVVRFADLMLLDEVGDLVLTSKAGYDIAKDYEIFVSNYKGGHGGISKELINVPYIIYLPGSDAGRIKVARSEDVGATIMKYMEIGSEYELSGRSLLK